MFKTKKIPEVGEHVMIKIVENKETHSEVEIIEYNMKGILLISEISHRRLKISDYKKTDRIEEAVVIRVENGLIDLSKKKISYNEKVKYREEYNNRKLIQLIVNNSVKNKEVFFNEVIYPLENKLQLPFIEIIRNDRELIRDFSKDSFNDSLKEDIENFIKESFVKIPKILYRGKAVIKLWTSHENGISILKSVLLKSLDNVQVLTISSPEYSLTYENENLECCLETLNTSIKLMREELCDRGFLEVIVEPNVGMSIDRNDVSDEVI